MFYGSPLAMHGCIVFASESLHTNKTGLDCVVVYNLSTANFHHIQITDYARKNSCKIVNYNNMIGVLTFDQRSSHQFDVFISSFDVHTCTQESWSNLFRSNHMEPGYEPIFGFAHQLVLCFCSNSNNGTPTERTTQVIYICNPRDDSLTFINRFISDGQSWFNVGGQFFYSMVHN